MPFIIHSLGERLYGVWLLIAAFVGYYGLLDLGISSAVTRFVSRAIGAGRREDNKYYVSSAFFVLCGIGLLIIAISLAASFLAHYFITNSSDLSLFRFAVLLLGCAVGLSFPLRIFDGILNANLRFDLKRYIEIGEVVFRSCLVVLFLKLDYGIYGLAVAGATAMLLDFGLKAWAAFRIDRTIAVHLRCFDVKKLKEMGDFAIFNFIAGLSLLLNNRIDLYVITLFATLKTVSHYGVALSLTAYFYQFFAAIQAVLGPFFSQKDGEGDLEAIRENMLLFVRLSSVISCVLSLLVILYGKLFVLRWLGESFSTTYIYIIILFAPLVISYGLFPTLFILNTTGHHRLSTMLDLLRGVTNLILSLILGYFYGAVGVAWGTAIPAVLFDIILKPVFSCRVIKLNPFKLWRSSISIAFLTVALFAPVWFLYGRHISHTYTELIAVAFFHILVFTVPAFFIVLSRNDREWLYQQVRQKVSR